MLFVFVCLFVLYFNMFLIFTFVCQSGVCCLYVLMCALLFKKILLCIFVFLFCFWFFTYGLRSSFFFFLGLFVNVYILLSVLCFLFYHVFVLLFFNFLFYYLFLCFCNGCCSYWIFFCFVYLPIYVSCCVYFLDFLSCVCVVIS
jgi:hypothetical protein